MNPFNLNLDDGGFVARFAVVAACVARLKNLLGTVIDSSGDS